MNKIETIGIVKCSRKERMVIFCIDMKFVTFVTFLMYMIE